MWEGRGEACLVLALVVGLRATKEVTEREHFPPKMRDFLKSTYTLHMIEC